MYSSIWQILTSLSANSKWPSHIIVPVWWTVLVSSKAEKRRWGHRTRAPLQAFSGPRKGKQQLTLLTLLDSSICFLQRVVSLEKPQARAVVPTKTETFPQQSLAASAECWLFLFLSSRGAKHRNHGCLKGQKTPVLLSATLGKLTVLASRPVAAV